jgi:vacuolar protein sorting-associated protein 53
MEDLLKDPLDVATFDPIDFINNKFPTESSLEDLETFSFGISSQIAALDEEISSTVQAQSHNGVKAKEDIQEAQKAIANLFDIVLQIKSKASQSERTVQELCADIRKLDCAKTHLQTTITSLKRLQMLITAVNQLEEWRELPLKQVANMFEVVKQLLVHFTKYSSIPKIKKLIDVIAMVESTLSSFVKIKFEAVGDLNQITSSLGDESGELADVCLVVDALGNDIKDDIVQKLVDVQLKDYDDLFGMGGEHFKLEDVERRWAWFKRLAKNIDTKLMNVVPEKWSVLRTLCITFCDKTGGHILSLLQNSGTEHDRISKSTVASTGEGNESSIGQSVDVSSLLKALQTTLRFEEEMSKRFESKSQSSDLDTDANIEEKKNSTRDLDSATPSVPNERPIMGSISKHFDGFLKPYILLERGNLAEMVARITREETEASVALVSYNEQEYDPTVPEPPAIVNEAGVLHSSTSMFVFVKNSIKRCTALSTGQTFFLLHKEFKTCLLKYADWLAAKLPSPLTQNNGTVSYKLSGPIEEICHVVNTCEYCAEVVPTLETMIQGRIDSIYKDGVDLSEVTEHYLDLSARAAKTLVGALMTLLEPGFRKMAGVQWGTMEVVGEESPYVYAWQALLVKEIPSVRAALSNSGLYFKNSCTKLATALIARYLETILKQRKITEPGTQQLLLDTYNLKTLLLQLHSLGIDSGETKSAVPLIFNRLVTSKISHVETVIKLIGTAEEVLVERLRMMWPEGTSADLTKIMNIKNMRRGDQQKLLKMFTDQGGKTAESKEQDGGTGGMGFDFGKIGF